LALSARDAVEPEQIFRTTYHGLNLLNEAVELEPDDMEIRMLRAFVLNALPSPFFPSRLAKDDFQVLKAAEQAAFLLLRAATGIDDENSERLLQLVR